ncbi:hypothetical protein CRUP_018876 [Coryphaenoides rupestris]|nr:hypothetical protein CRUP_018876 [Coryphaenoides rupestris]
MAEGQKLFSCHICNTSFSTKGSLKVHMRLHTGSKPFKCPFCELRFRTSGHRKTHIQCHYRPNAEVRRSKRNAAAAAASSSSSSSASSSSSNNSTTSSSMGGHGANHQGQDADQGSGDGGGGQHLHLHQQHQHQHQLQHQQPPPPLGAEGLQSSVGLLQTSGSDPNIYLPGSHVLTGQFDQSVLQQPGLVGQAILPASMSVTSLPPSTSLSHGTVSQSLVMSPGGVAGDGSVTLTLAEAQGMLEGLVEDGQAAGRAKPLEEGSRLRNQCFYCSQLVEDGQAAGRAKPLEEGSRLRNQCFYCSQMPHQGSHEINEPSCDVPAPPSFLVVVVVRY